MRSQPSSLRRNARLLALLAGPLLGTGCVLGNDSDPPTIAVDFFWESDRIRDATCSSASVETMDYKLLDATNDNVLKEESDRNCANGFEFSGIDVGNYVIEVTGYDADHNPTWTGSCDLWLDRFDRYFECDVLKSSS